VLSHRLKGTWSLRQRQMLPLHSIELFILHRRSISLSTLGIIFTHMLFTIRGESRGLIFHSSICFWRFMPKGEKVLAQSKRTAPPPISIFFSLSICMFLKNFKLVSYFDTFFKLVYPFSNLISKTLLNTKRRISLRRSFV
jgi:hypothetical protein